MESQACVQLQYSLTRLDEIEAAIRILQEKLITEEASALPDIENTLRAYAFDIKSEERQIRSYIHTLEKAHKERSSDEVDQALKDIGSPASLDRSFEGGIVSLTIKPEVLEKLKSYTTAIEALKNADATTLTVSSDMDKIAALPTTLWTTPRSNLDILILKHPVGRETANVTTEKERDELTEKMDTLGYRPLEISELIALGILKPEFTKDGPLNSLKKYSLGGHGRVPYLCRRGDERRLDSRWSSDDWRGRNRFLFVRK